MAQFHWISLSLSVIMTKVYDTLQNPLIATCSFKINDENRQRNVDEERERKRQKEVQDALKRRAERKSQPKANVTIPLKEIV